MPPRRKKPEYGDWDVNHQSKVADPDAAVEKEVPLEEPPSAVSPGRRKGAQASRRLWSLSGRQKPGHQQPAPRADQQDP